GSRSLFPNLGYPTCGQSIRTLARTGPTVSRSTISIGRLGEGRTFYGTSRKGPTPDRVSHHHGTSFDERVRPVAAWSNSGCAASRTRNAPECSRLRYMRPARECSTLGNRSQASSTSPFITRTRSSVSRRGALYGRSGSHNSGPRVG